MPAFCEGKALHFSKNGKTEKKREISKVERYPDVYNNCQKKVDFKVCTADWHTVNFIENVTISSVVHGKVMSLFGRNKRLVDYASCAG